jgi:diguanylate cyclase (GGDEF)-like protein
LLAVLFIDLDGFKAVNDAYGHEAGDQVLISVAARMRAALRDSDTLARLGGDEFVALLTDLNVQADAAPTLSRLLEAAAQPIDLQGRSVQVTASIGASFYPQAQKRTADELLREADLAMYQAKLAGKNQVCLGSEPKPEASSAPAESSVAAP